MSWQAERTGSFVNHITYPDIQESDYSNKAIQNINEITKFMRDNHWTDEAIAGMLGNIEAESGFNPWRYYGDSVAGQSIAYGLVQFHPPSYYIGGEGVGKSGYAPSLGINNTQADDHASPSDGNAQCFVINSETNTKYADKSSIMPAWDLSSVTTLADYKRCSDLETSTKAWLLNYETPSTDPATLELIFGQRFLLASFIYNHLLPDKQYTPLYFYMGKKFKRKKGLL